MTDQTQTDEPLSAADFDASGYKTILQDDFDDCQTMSVRLRTAADAAADAGESRYASVLHLLANVTSMMLTPDDRANPFRPFFQFGDQRSSIPTDFKDESIVLFAEVATSVTNAQLRARLADLIWLRRRQNGISFVHLAIDAYREAPPDAATWFSTGRAYWTRALQLALSIGVAAGTRVGDIEASLVSAMFAPQDDSFVPLQAAQVLLENGCGQSRRADISARLEALAVMHAAAGRHRESIAYFDAAGKWYGRMGAKFVEMTVGAANCWEAQGDSHGAGLAALHFYENAVKTFRTVPGPDRALHAVDQRIDALHAKVRAAGSAATGQMQRIHTSPVDITELVERATAAVRDKQPLDALAAFAHLYRGASVATIRATAETNLNASIFRQIFGSTVLSAQGNTIARQPAAGDGAEEAEEVLQAQMVRDYQVLVGLVVTGEIKPAMAGMNLQHMFTIWDFEELCSNSPFVPSDRVQLVAHGLYAGYCGDLVQAVHILVPQVENIVRIHLQQAGAVTATTSPEGIIMENGMSTLVKLPQMVTVFGENLTFELMALFCDQNGPNLRNEVAHGLISKSTCESDAGIYAWWLVFSLMFKTFWQEQQRRAESAAGVAGSNESNSAAPEA